MWNGFIIVIFGFLVIVFVVGNFVMIKMFEFNFEINKVVKKIIVEVFDDLLVLIFDGEVEVFVCFFVLLFNYLMFIGLIVVGCYVMCVVFVNLVLVILELGGKCLVIVCLDMDIDDVVS